MKAMKVLSVILMAVVLVATMGTMVMASSVVDNLFNGTGNTEQLESVGANIISIITTIGIIVAVVVLLVLGIKYMMGSASEKAEYKKTMIPYLVGAILIFGASAIAKAVISMTASITS